MTRFLIPIVFCIVLLASSWSLLRPGMGLGHDLNHQARIFEMAEGLRDGNIPVIWSQNLAYGYGMPLFQFYAPLPYFFGALLYLLGFNLATSVELLILLASIISLWGAYRLGTKLFTDTLATILFMVLVGMAPYRAVDLFVRSAVSEAWAIAFIPWVLLGILQVIRKSKWGWLTLALSYCCLILSHNLTAVIATPFFVLYALGLLLFQHKAWATRLNILLQLLGSALLGLGLSAFYLIPALLEKSFTQIDRFILGSFYDFRQHFLYIRQFFQPWGDWEYGGSGWGPHDEMSFFLGYAQLIILCIAGALTVWLVINLIRKKTKPTQEAVLMMLFLALTLLSLTATLLKTQLFWELVPFLKYVQFPWRLLSVTIVFGSLLAGSVAMLIKQKYRSLFVTVLILLAIMLNARYFQSEKNEKFDELYQDYAEHIRTQTSNNLFDYLPSNINFLTNANFYLYKDEKFTDVEVPMPSLFSTVDAQKVQPTVILNESTHKRFALNTLDKQEIALGIAYYPGWQVAANEIMLDVRPNQYGLLSFTAPAGSTVFDVTLEDTPIRFWSKIISIIAIITAAGLSIKVAQSQRRSKSL